MIGLLIILSLASVLARHRRHGAVRATVALTLAALAFQVVVGAAVVTLRLPAALRGLHLALASAVWAGTVILAVIVGRLSPDPALPQRQREMDSVRRPARDVVLDYVSLAKPRIIPLLLITALGGMMMAERGWPSTGLVVLTLLGGALALRLRGDYARAKVPMLPVVRGEAAARRQIVGYTLVLVAVTLAIVLTGVLGPVYLVGAALLGAAFIALAVANLLARRQRWSRILFDYSIAYLGLLFAVMVADRMIGKV
ncbi:MAG: hypothetical protein E6J51_00470 [Chloroflexi bacterium]|nr:MAG: hypothetical protein E6J51_00470 [Chloroflexota bacterium]